MGWKQVAKSKDLIILEKNLKNYKIKIEARKNNEIWEIFKTKIKGDSSSLISQYKVRENELKEIINKLKKSKINEEKTINKNNELNENFKVSENFFFNTPEIYVSFKRAFKEEFSEKWNFFVNLNRKQEKDDKNFIVFYFEKFLKADVVMHKRYKTFEDEIIRQLKDNLSLDLLADDLYFNIYYYEDISYIEEENENYFWEDY